MDFWNYCFWNKLCADFTLSNSVTFNLQMYVFYVGSMCWRIMLAEVNAAWLFCQKLHYRTPLSNLNIPSGGCSIAGSQEGAMFLEEPSLMHSDYSTLQTFTSPVHLYYDFWDVCFNCRWCTTTRCSSLHLLYVYQSLCRCTTIQVHLISSAVHCVKYFTI